LWDEAPEGEEDDEESDFQEEIAREDLTGYRERVYFFLDIEFRCVVTFQGGEFRGTYAPTICFIERR
jgi:hypothetical protein